jgi:TolB-like protein/Flp pilus assembly protein TadD/DNA-binding winged helix-turn-helix (wHTH) protein
MIAFDLQQGFRLGDWQVEPGERRIRRSGSGASELRRLSERQAAALLYLAAHHGGLVTLAELAQATGSHGDDAETQVHEIIAGLRALLGDFGEQASYVLAVGAHGYSLIRAPHPPETAVAAELPAPAAPLPLPAPPAAASAAAALPSQVAESRPGLFASLRDNRLVRSAVAYTLFAWLIVQVIANISNPLHLPLWTQTLVVVLLILGLPIVLVISWARGPGGEATAAGSPLIRFVRRNWRLAIVLPVLAVIGFAGFQLWNWMQNSGWTRAPRASIAVLPLLDMSTSADSGYLGDGLSEELSSRLAQLPGLRVAARTSAFAYRGGEQDVREIGRQLGVRYVLEGSVRREGDRVRVTAQLINAETGYHAWTETYDRNWRDLLRLQEEISRAITTELRVVLTPEQERELARPATDDPKAYDLYLAGLAQFRLSRGLQTLERAQESFAQALAADPNFARAHAGLCQVAIARYQLTRASEVMRMAEEACRKALESDSGLVETELALADLYRASGRNDQAKITYEAILARNPRNADALVGLGSALEGRGELVTAEKRYREAIDVEPGYWGTHNALGNYLFRHGRSREAAAAYQRVTVLRPGNATGFNNLGAALLTSGDLGGAVLAFEGSARIEPNRSAYVNLGTTYYYQRRYADAVGMYQKAAALAAEDYNVWGGLGDAQRQLPDKAALATESYRRAVLLAEQSLGVNASDPSTWAQLGYYYARIGDADRAKRYLDRAAEIGDKLPYVQIFLAMAAADRGDKEAAIAALRRAVEAGYPAALVAAEPAFDSLRSDPRLRKLAGRG